MNEEATKNELTLTQQQGLAPVDVDSAVEFWKNYQELTTALLEDGDYQKIGKKSFKKKSAWRKYATAFNISDEIIKEDIRYDSDGRVVTATYHVRATASNGREGVGIGVCSIFDKAHEYDKLDRNNKVSCEGPCNGRRHFDKPEHDIPSTAHTRAKNRAIADLIGAGEVTADEMDSQNISNNISDKKTRIKRVKKEVKKNKEESATVDAEFTKKEPNNDESKEESPIKDVTPSINELDLEQEKTISGDKVGNEAINRLMQKKETINKKNLVNEVQEMLGEQIITPNESQESRKIIMKC